MITPNGTLVHGIAAAQTWDKTNELVVIKGVDISDLAEKGLLNYEHDISSPSNILGKIIYANKILTEADCKNIFEKQFYRQLQKPFIYIVGLLFDGVGHPEAIKVASMLKFDYEAKKQNKNYKPVLYFSIEGAILERKNNKITEAIARRVTITIQPANAACSAELLPYTDYAAHIAPLIKHEQNNHDLIKTYLLGSLDVAPSNLTDTGALTRPEFLRKRIKQFIKFLQSKFNINKTDATYFALYLLKSYDQDIKTEQILEKIIYTDYEQLFNVDKKAIIENLNKTLNTLQELINSNEKLKTIFVTNSPLHNLQSIESMYHNYILDILNVFKKYNKNITPEVLLKNDAIEWANYLPIEHKKDIILKAWSQVYGDNNIDKHTNLITVDQNTANHESIAQQSDHGQSLLAKALANITMLIAAVKSLWKRS